MRPRLLIVDDARAIRLAVRGIFRNLDVDLFEATNGQEALTCYETQGGMDIVLLDWNMPVMDGLQFLKLLRLRPGNEKCKVVMVTTNNEFAKIQQALDAGANEYIMKPFDQEMILGKLDSIGVSLPSK